MKSAVHDPSSHNFLMESREEFCRFGNTNVFAPSLVIIFGRGNVPCPVACMVLLFGRRTVGPFTILCSVCMILLSFVLV